MTEFSLLLPKALRQLPSTHEWNERLVISVWRRAVGESLAQRTKPFRLYKSALFVLVPSLMWKRELHHLQEEIIEKLHHATGRKIVEALEFRVDPEFDSETVAVSVASVAEGGESLFPPPDCIEDEELRSVFAATASSYLNRTR
jgi:predicted nucleic acid-binding Zn ribbon protein